jgi:hypothetical protein
MLALSNCLPNVAVLLSRLAINSFSGNQTATFLECLRAMHQYDWKYAIILQVLTCGCARNKFGR